MYMKRRLHNLLMTMVAALCMSAALPAHAQGATNTTIGSQAELEAFRDAVNGGKTYENETVELTASFEVDGWTEGIGSNGNYFLGTLDGGGHVITLTGSASLFGQIGKSGVTTGTVKNLGVKAAVDGYKDYIGAIAGSSYGTIQYCFVEGSIESSKDYLGGIVGKNVGTIEDCYTTVSIKATGIVTRVGGIAGLNYKINSNAGTIQRCYATGAINNINTNFGAGVGGIVGSNSAGTTIKNCIALNTSITGKAAGRIIISNYGSSDALADNYASPLITGEWTEKEAGKKNGADLTESNFITNATTEGGAFYGWNNGNTAWDFTTPANLPTLTGFTADQPVKDITRESTITKLLIKEIKTAADLATFRDAVNSGETYEGKTVTLANDITVTGWEVGIGIEADKKPFSGTFDGQGHVINLKGSTSLFALIGKANETYGTVKNLGVNAEIIANTTNTGGIVGHNYGTIQNCYTKGTITNDSYYTGGIVGDNGGTIQNCYSTALCTGNNATGGIVGKHSGTILQCYATGAINGKSSAGGIAGTFGGNKELKNCIALNTSITFKDTEGKSGRIISSPTASFLSNNHASPLLPGTLMETEKKDGANLTDDTFIGKGADEGAFAKWLATAWEFGDNSNLPKLKTTGLNPDIVISGQGDDNGNMPARSNFVESVIEISTAVTYNADMHNDKIIRVKDKGEFTVNADGVSLKKLILEEGGQVVAEKAFNCNQLLAPRTLNNKWTAYGSPVNMQAVAKDKQTFYSSFGYDEPSNQTWSQRESDNTSFEIYTLNLIAVESKNDVPVTLTAPISGSSYLTIPADDDKKVETGSKLNTGIFLFCANPTLKEVPIQVVYILSDDGTRFERKENVKVKPFQSYLVANAATSNAVLSLRAGGIPTANDPIALPDSDFRIWGSNGQLYLSADKASEVAIYDLSGRLIRRFTLTGDQTLNLGRGLYLVRSNNITYKVSL